MKDTYKRAHRKLIETVLTLTEVFVNQKGKNVLVHTVKIAPPDNFK